MYRIYKFRRLIFFVAICFLPLPLCGSAATKTMRAAVLTEGSVPPAQVLYTCVHQLDNKPFSDQQINDCAAKLAAIHFLRDVKVRTRETDDWWNVEFVLTAKSLTLDELKIDSFDNQQIGIMKMLALNENNLRVGGIYSPPAEESTYQGIRQFYRAKGKLVGVVPKVTLNFDQGKAGILFTVVEGPTIPFYPLIPPYGESCSDRVMSISWFRSDDGLPLELIESGLALSYPFSCFSEALAQRDKSYLSKMPILSGALVDYSGPVGSRHIEYKLKAKPLKVEQTNLRGFGNIPSDLQNTDPTLLSNLSLRTGDFFSHNAATKSVDYLKKKFSRDRFWTEIIVQEELLGQDAIRVTYSVLVFPLQTVIVDGTEIN